MARTEGQWQKGISFISPSEDVPVLLKNTYLNFGGVSIGESGYGIRDNAGTIEVKSSGGSWSTISTGGGEANTAANLGAGEGIYASKIGVALNFKSLVAGTGMGISSDGNTITLTATSGSGDVVGPASSVADRIAVFNGLTGKLLKDGGKTLAEVLNTDNHTDGTTNKVFTAAEKSKLGNVETNADVTDAVNVGSSIHGATAKTTPVDADTMPLIDSAASNVLKKVTWANIKATIKAYTDTLYAAALGADDNYVTDAEKAALHTHANKATLDNITAAYTTAEATKLGHISITQAVDLDALETASHAAVTVTDSTEIDFTLTGQDITASLKSGSIDETKLDTSVNASLDLADSALQPAAIGTTVQAYDADLTTWAGITPGTGVGTALAVNVGSAGAVVTNGGALGTPSSGTLTNCTGLPLSGVVDSTSEALGVGTLEVGHASDTTFSRVSAGVAAIEGNNIITANVADATYLPILFDATPNADHTATGLQTSTLAAGATIAIGECVYLGSGGKWLKADNDATATTDKLLAIALEAKNDTEAMRVALPGTFVRDDSWNWTVGAAIYLSDTAGALTETKPTKATDRVVRVVGYAVSADVMWFMPETGVTYA